MTLSTSSDPSLDQTIRFVVLALLPTILTVVADHIPATQNVFNKLPRQLASKQLVWKLSSLVDCFL